VDPDAWYGYEVPGCYDLHFDKDSVDAAIKNEDVTAVKLDSSSGICAPGWNPGLVLNDWLADYKKCARLFEAGKEVFGQNLPKRTIIAYEWPEGWDMREELNAAHLKYHFLPEVKEVLYTSASCYHLANSILGGLAIAGGVLVIIGVILECVIGGGDVSN
jgi:hypothetical protein